MVTPLRPFRPVVRPSHSFKNQVLIAAIGRALVQGHNDIAAEFLLKLYHQLRGEEMLAAINMGPESDTLISNPPQRYQAKYLIATTIGEYRPFPRHKFVQSADLLNNIYSGSEIEVIGVAQYHRHPDRLKIVRG
jgi:hypothetical protein